MTHTKKALMMSIFSMVLCMAMLMGTTFAWFTDTAGTGVNIVKSGDLDLEIVKDDTAESPVNASNKIAFENGSNAVLWDCGSTFTTEGFKIKNTGKLALKYKLMVNVGEIDEDLRDNMTFTILEGNNDSIGRGKVVEGKLAAKSETSSEAATQDAEVEVKAESTSAVYYIQGHMKDDADNKCQGATLKNITITVIATQDNVESDSNGNSYDSEAAFEVEDEETFRNSLESGGVIQLANDIIAIKPEVSAAEKKVSSLVPQMTVTKDTTLDLNGKSLTVKPDPEGYGKASPLLIAVIGGTLTINGDENSVFSCEAGNNQVYGININEADKDKPAKVIINGGKFYGALTAVQVQKGRLEINGGFFDMARTCKEQVSHYAKYVVNAIDANYKNGNAKISIKGGTFVNFDPSDNPEGEGTSYVADGYKVVSETHGSEIWYTVVEKE